MKILVIDDMASTREVIKLYLGKLYPDADVIEADTVDSAMPIIKSNVIEYIFCDMFMPKLTGLDCLDLVRKNETGNKAAFMLVTGNADSNIIIKAVEAGIDSYIAKPFNEEDLKRKIDQACKMRKKRLK